MNGVSSYKYSAVLNKDHIFTKKENRIITGTYVITEDTMTLIYHPQTYGGPEVK